MAGEYLTGAYRVRTALAALADTRRLFPRAKHAMEVRRHALKLRHFPGGESGGQVMDLDWSWIQTLPGMNIGELRIHDEIGGHENLRLIFFVGDVSRRDPLPMIWILRVMEKKKNSFSPNQVAIFKARRGLIMERFYNN